MLSPSVAAVRLASAVVRLAPVRTIELSALRSSLPTPPSQLETIGNTFASASCAA